MPDNVPIIEDHSPMHLSSPMTSFDAPDFIFDDVRARLLAFARAKALGAKDLRVDCGPIAVPTPAGLQIQCMLMISISNPLIGQPRLIASAAMPIIEPPDALLQDVVSNLYGEVMDQAAAIRRMPAQPGS